MAQPLRILHCLRAPVGGLFRHVCDLSLEQTARGHAVGVVAALAAAADVGLWRERLGELAAHLTLGLHDMPMRREIAPTDALAAWRIAAIARTLKIDVLHGHGAKGGAHARLAGMLLRARGHTVTVLYTPHGGSLHYASSSPKGRVLLNLERALQPLTDGLIFESAFASTRYRERMGGSKVPSRIIPNGVAPGDLIPVTPGTDAADLLFVGELRTLKGVDVLLHAIPQAELMLKRPITLAIVGEGPQRAGLEEITQLLELGDQVTFHGALPAQIAFAMGRVLIVPSRAESLPYVVLEAAAAGLPVVATNVGGIPEIFAGTGQTLVPPGDAPALAVLIRDALADPGAAAARAQTLRARVASIFSVAGMTDAVQDFTGELRRPLTKLAGQLSQPSRAD